MKDKLTYNLNQPDSYFTLIGSCDTQLRRLNNPLAYKMSKLHTV